LKKIERGDATTFPFYFHSRSSCEIGNSSRNPGPPTTRTPCIIAAHPHVDITEAWPYSPDWARQGHPVTHVLRGSRNLAACSGVILLLPIFIFRRNVECYQIKVKIDRQPSWPSQPPCGRGYGSGETTRLGCWRRIRSLLASWDPR
jgi:hypothetical protein